MDDNLETNWTSFDLYYKGFHIKKSIPENLGLETVKKTIEKAKDLGFEPSWNKETSKEQAKANDPIMQVTEDYTRYCKVHPTEEVKKSKSGNWWHKDNRGQICVGKGYFTPKERS